MEQVLVVDRGALEELLSGQIFVTEGIERIRSFIIRNHFYLPREQAEYDTSVKQIIPYGILCRGEEIFLLRRLKKQTETRLHDKLSIGVGGHINPGEEGQEDPLEAGLLRELMEEAAPAEIFSLDCVGVLNENDGGVSDFHTGLVYRIEVRGEVTIGEPEKMSGRWVSRDELRRSYAGLETWSRITAAWLLGEPEG